MDLADDLEAVAFVEGEVAGVRGLEIGDQAVFVAALQRARHQGGAQAAGNVGRVGGDQRQVIAQPSIS